MISFPLTFQPEIFFERRGKWLKILENLKQLARKVLFEICASLLKSLRNVLFSQEFSARHGSTSKAFTRNRCLPLPTLMCFLINLVRGSYQNELDQFFKALNDHPVARRVVSKAALTKARAKLGYSAFIELNRHLIGAFENMFQLKGWHGHRLLAVDGSTLRLPRIKEIAEHFGVWTVKKGKPCPMARISHLFDTLNKISIAAVISPKGIDERQHACELFLNLMPKDLVLLDRGYPAFWLFKAILSMNANFCARISTKWKIVRDFIESGLLEQIVELQATNTSIKDCKALGLDTDPITLRLIHIELESGETEVLITSLIDTGLYPCHLFKDLYHQRWPVEEDYKYMKCWIEMENFTGKTVHSIYQDFHAKIFAKNLTSILCFPVRQRLQGQGIKVKHPHQVNFVQALSKMKHVIVLLFLRPLQTLHGLVENLHDIFERTTEPFRPDRRYPRNHKASVRRHSCCYKAIA